MNDMNAADQALSRLRSVDPIGTGAVRAGFDAAGASFVAVGGPLEERWRRAVTELDECIHPIGSGVPVLNEGGVYHGSWIESTGTINAEVLARFAPQVAKDTHLLFAEYQRDDGMIPYKVTDAGPGFSQIQIVTPLARTVWNTYLLTGKDTSYLARMYDAMEQFDGWLERYRDTRGTGGVEAFCTFDTGHDLSPRFWFVPDRCFRDDARLVDPDSPTLPFVSPDLTANVVCQRWYLAIIAAELGLDPTPWQVGAQRSMTALYTQCFDQHDGLFYDRDATGAMVRVQSDVLLRVLACEIGDADFFARALERYVMNTGKFLAHYGFTSLAMDDPRFDHDYTRNSWGGPSNFLTLIRAPHAFEHHGHVAELGMATAPALAALTLADRFPQCLDPWTGTAGYTEVYSPSILWFLDTVERQFGILPCPDGEIWFSGLTPTRLDHGAAALAIAYARTIEGVRFELSADDERVVVHRDGSAWLQFPRGWRAIVTSGTVTAVVGMSPTPVSGELVVGGRAIGLSLAPNDRIELDDMVVGARSGPGFVAPHS